MKRFLPYFKLLKPVRVPFGIALLCGALFGISSGLGLPLIINYILPRLFSGEPLGLNEQLLLAGLIPLSFSLRGLFGFVNTYLIAYCGLSVLERLRTRVFRKVQSLPYAYLQARSHGDMLVRMMSDTGKLQQTVTAVSNDLIKQPVSFLSGIVGVIYLAAQSAELLKVLFALGVIPLTVLPIRAVGKVLLKRATELQEGGGKISTRVMENLRGAREIRLYNLQDKETEGFFDLQQYLLRLQLKMVRYQQGLSPIIEIMTSFGVAIAVILAARSNVDVEQVIPLIAALYFSYGPLKKFGMISNMLKQGEASLIRVEEVLFEPDRITDPPNPKPLGRAKGQLDFANVTFGYGDVPVLREVSVSITPGETVALVGPSGAGKTTFAHLVPRLYDVTAGTIRMDGVDVREYRLDALRNQVAFVTQDPFLYRGSVAENISLGKPGATDEQVRQAVRSAQAEDFIKELADGYETLCGDAGGRFSGGQRQRIALARAYLKDAPFLILDEPTSALDAESEERVQIALRELMPDRTTLIISHRFALIRFAQRILVFQEGRIVGDGTFDELLASSELFRSLYQAAQASEKTPA